MAARPIRRGGGATYLLGMAGLGVAATFAIGPPAAADARALGTEPQTTITSGPDVTFQRRPRFEFGSSTPTAAFECSLDAHRYRPCSSPHRVRRVATGRHALSVRALDAGVTGPPAGHAFRVVDTAIAGALDRATFERRQAFRLRLLAAGADVAPVFECSLDGRRYRRCAEEYRTGRLGFGGHALRVRGETAEAGPDPSPAVHRFKVERRRVTFGHSVAGRPLRAYRVGEAGASRTALAVGSIHGDETEGHEVIGRLKREYREISGVELWLVETVNPDGVARDTRKNARGVDLNRNFGVGWNGSAPPSSGYYAGTRPFSEPESRAVRELAKRVEPRVTVWYHQPWGAVLLPCHGSAPIEREYARISSMPTSCRGSGLPGTARRWQNENVGGRAFVVELRGGDLGSAAVRRHARAVAKVARPG